MAELFRHARKIGLVGDTPADKLRVFAAAARARRVGSVNPCGLFVQVVRRRLWRHISQAEEDEARRELAGMPDFQFGTPTAASTPVPAKGTRPRDETDAATIRMMIASSLGSVSAAVSRTDGIQVMLASG